MEDIFEADFQEKFDPSHPAVRNGIFPLAQFSMKRPEMSPGCFLEGTKILLESGEQKPVEQLTVAPMNNPTGGDVLLSIDGVKTYIVAKIPGLFEHPCIQIKAKPIGYRKTDGLMQIGVTMNHTLAVGGKRIVQAANIGVGRRVSTVDGDALIEEINYEQGKSKVWNIYLASEKFIKDVYPTFDNNREGLFTFLLVNSSLGLTSKQHLLFSNGFLTGDLFLQMQAGEIASKGISLSEFI